MREEPIDDRLEAIHNTSPDVADDSPKAPTLRKSYNFMRKKATFYGVFAGIKPLISAPFPDPEKDVI